MSAPFRPLPLQVATVAFLGVLTMVAAARFVRDNPGERVQALVATRHALADLPLGKPGDMIQDSWMPTAADVLARAHRALGDRGLSLKAYGKVLHVEALHVKPFGGAGYLVWTRHRDRQVAAARVQAWIQASRELVTAGWLRARGQILAEIRKELARTDLSEDSRARIQALERTTLEDQSEEQDRLWVPGPVGVKHE